MGGMDKKWEQIQEALHASFRGEDPRPVVSQRTLFGIPSSVEVQMAKFAAEIAHERAKQTQESKEGALDNSVASASEQVERGGQAERAERGGETEPLKQTEQAECDGQVERDSQPGQPGQPNQANQPAQPSQPESVPSSEQAKPDLRAQVLMRATELGSAAQVGRGMRYFIEAGRAAGFDIPAYPYDPKGDLRAFLRSVGASNLPEYYETLGIDQERYEDVQTHALIALQENGRTRAYLVKGAEYCEAARFVPLAQSPLLSMCDKKTLRAIAKIIGVQEKTPPDMAF